MRDTPRTDAEYASSSYTDNVVGLGFPQELERELAAKDAECKALIAALEDMVAAFAITVPTSSTDGYRFKVFQEARAVLDKVRI